MTDAAAIAAKRPLETEAEVRVRIVLELQRERWQL